jgi:uncharacterized protein DUF3631
MTTHPPIIIPHALKVITAPRNWVVWKWVTGKNGKRTKPPYRADTPSRHADSTKPETWCDIKTAMLAYTEGKADGIGFALRDTDIGAIDLDDCRNAKTGELHPFAKNIVDRAGSYVEVTPSGEGLRIIGLATGPKLHRKFTVPGMSVELYRKAERYICITGRELSTSMTELANIDALLDDLLAELDGTKQKKSTTNGAGTTAAGRKHDLDSLIKDGCGEDFGGDRSRAVWYVINTLLKQGKTADDVVAVLLERSNGISAHIYDQPKPEDYARKQVEKAQKEQADDPDAELARLAKLTTIEYEQQRKGAAEKLDVRASILDKLVEAERLRLNPDDDGKQGQIISFPEIEPWSEPVDGAALLDGIASIIGNHVVMSDYARDICALWTVHTYFIKRFKISPKLSIRSPARRCGKTTLIEVLAELVFRAWTTGSITKAALFRIIDMWHPTLLIDEVDTFVGEDEELKGILNHGHRYDGAVTRTVGDDHEPRRFSVYAAVALSGIGGLAATLADRSVTIDLQRRRPSEAIAPLRIGRMGHLHELRRRIVRWVVDHEERIAERDPEMPSIIDREADNWHVLLAIADQAGGKWTERARKAAEAAHAATADDPAARLELLLGDIRRGFADSGTKMQDLFGVEQVIISSAKLVKAGGQRPVAMVAPGRCCRWWPPPAHRGRRGGPVPVPARRPAGRYRGGRRTALLGSALASFRQFPPSEPDRRTAARRYWGSRIPHPDSHPPGCPDRKRQKCPYLLVAVRMSGSAALRAANSAQRHLRTARACSLQGASSPVRPSPT